MSEARKLSASESTRLQSGRCADHGLRACEECPKIVRVHDFPQLTAANIALAAALSRVAELEAALGLIANPEDGNCPVCGIEDQDDCPVTIARAALYAGKVTP